MTSGRDVYLEKLTDKQETIVWKQKQIERLEQLKQTYIDELQRIYKHITRLEMEIENDE